MPFEHVLLPFEHLSYYLLLYVMHAPPPEIPSAAAGRASAASSAKGLAADRMPAAMNGPGCSVWSFAGQDVMLL